MSWHWDFWDKREKGVEYVNTWTECPNYKDCPELLMSVKSLVPRADRKKWGNYGIVVNSDGSHITLLHGPNTYSVPNSRLEIKVRGA